MVVKRIQGRPARGEGDVGRARLIEAAQVILRSQMAAQVSSKAVAEVAGVTPALVSYYFPDKSSLLDAATRPVVEKHLTALKRILESEDDPQTKLREVITVFIEANTADHQLLEHHLDFGLDGTADAGPHEESVRLLRRQLVAFLEAGMAAGAWGRFDPAFVVTALWGICRSIAQSSQGGSPSHQEEPGQERARAQAALVLDLISRGIGRQGAGPDGKPVASIIR